MNESVRDKLDHLSMVCANPSDGLSAGMWCQAANEGLLLARSLQEQLGTWPDEQQTLHDRIEELQAALQQVQRDLELQAREIRERLDWILE